MPGVGVVRIQSQRLPLAPQSQRSENFSKRLQSPVCIAFGVVPVAISQGDPPALGPRTERGVSMGQNLSRSICDKKYNQKHSLGG